MATKQVFNPLTGNFDLINDTGASSGDVVGPASSSDNEVVTYSGTSGKLIKENSDITVNYGTIARVGGFTGARIWIRSLLEAYRFGRSVKNESTSTGVEALASVSEEGCINLTNTLLESLKGLSYTPTTVSPSGTEIIIRNFTGRDVTLLHGFTGGSVSNVYDFVFPDQRDYILRANENIHLTMSSGNSFNTTGWVPVSFIPQHHDTELTINQINWREGEVFHRNLTANISFDFDNVEMGMCISVVLINNTATDFTLAFGAVNLKKRADFPTSVKKNSTTVITFIASAGYIYAASVEELV